MKRQTYNTTSDARSDPKHETVLVMTLGTAPSVFTSTIWALAQHERLIPHRIKVLTTRRGRDLLIEQVFTKSPEFGGKTAWEYLSKNLEADGFDLTGRLEFAPSSASLRVFAAVPPGERMPRELDEITSQAENEQVADAMLETLRGVMNDDTRVIASIAGGRKTVSALFYACVSLIGRSYDRIIHVIVSEPFERGDLRPRFFFPEQKCARLVLPDGSSVRARDARTSVIEVPFVPLSNLFPRELGRTPGKFSVLIGNYRQEGQRQSLKSVQLIVCRSKPEIVVNGMPIALGPREQWLIIFLADQISNGHAAFFKQEEALEPMRKSFERLVAASTTKDPSDWRLKLKASWSEAWAKIETAEGIGIISGDIRRSCSSLAEKLRKSGHQGALLAASLPKRGRFAMDLTTEQVRFED